MVTVRKATFTDLESITGIYNNAVLTTTATFDSSPKNLDEQKVWFEKHGGKFPICVAESEGTILGWASLSEWSDRCAYADTAEISLYVHATELGKGIGTKLMESVLIDGQKGGLHTVLARIVEGNEASVHLHEKFGFQHVGVMREVGKKFGKLLSVYLMQKIYG
jgi:L-amino acid N-acyltransferase YncA